MNKYIFNTAPNGGFTLVEVLVGLLVIVGFISTAMQAIVTATAFKVKGQELSEATTWIQEDLERVRYEANRLDYNAVDPEIDYNVNLPACEATSNSLGYAAQLRDRIASNAPVETNQLSAVGNRPYTLRRTPILPTSAPYHVLSLEYEVVSADNIPISILHTKVIPDASLKCPS